MTNIQFLDWPAPESVKACFTLRSGGFSAKPFASFNLAQHVGDKGGDVVKNRQRLSSSIEQQRIVWLEQIHGTETLEINQQSIPPVPPKADASTTQQHNTVCAVMTADCLPVFFCDATGQQVAVAHAGWRGLCAGVLQTTAACFSTSSTLIAYLGPAISQAAFEVGDEVRQAFCAQYPECQLEKHFLSSNTPAKWMADLYGIARTILLEICGISAVFGGRYCTYTDSDRFFSYRRDKETGRMANLIWIED